jgi:hypothetical protein
MERQMSDIETDDDENGTITVDFTYDTSRDISVRTLTDQDVQQDTADTSLDRGIKDSSDLLDIDTDIRIVHDTNNKAAKTWEIQVASVGNWPEFKTKTCYKWIRIPLDGRTKVPYPCVWIRHCKKVWFLRIAYGGSGGLPADIDKIIADCAKIALIPALPILLTGNVGGAAAAFIGAFKHCIIAKGVQEAARFSAGFHSTKTCGTLRRV